MRIRECVFVVVVRFPEVDTMRGVTSPRRAGLRALSCVLLNLHTWALTSRRRTHA
jgi:hypothetical protein